MLLKPDIATGIRNIVFDLGGVLLDIDPRLSIEAFRELGVTGFTISDICRDNRDVFLEVELGRISEDEFIDALQGLVPEGIPRPTPEALRDAWNALLLPYDWRRFSLLDRLRESGYRLFLLSNTNLPHRRCFVDRFEREHPGGRRFESYFDRCFYSDALHLRKPDPAIYRHLLREAELRPEETLFIDDNRTNTDSAAALGIQTLHLAAPRTVFNLFE